MQRLTLQVRGVYLVLQGDRRRPGQGSDQLRSPHAVRQPNLSLKVAALDLETAVRSTDHYGGLGRDGCYDAPVHSLHLCGSKWRRRLGDIRDGGLNALSDDLLPTSARETWAGWPPPQSERKGKKRPGPRYPIRPTSGLATLPYSAVRPA